MVLLDGDNYDQLEWAAFTSSTLSIFSAYEMQIARTDNRNFKVWKMIWKFPILQRTKCFLLLFQRHKPMTKVEHHRRGFAQLDSYPLCGQALEIFSHFFKIARRLF